MTPPENPWSARSALDPCDGNHPEPACLSDQCHLKADEPGLGRALKKARKRKGTPASGATTAPITEETSEQTIEQTPAPETAVATAPPADEAPPPAPPAPPTPAEDAEPPPLPDAPITPEVVADEVPVATGEPVDAELVDAATGAPDPERPLEALSNLAPQLCCGSTPDPALDYKDFTLLVWCAPEQKLELPKFAGRLYVADIPATTRPTQQDLTHIAGAVQLAYLELKRGGRVLIACTDGLERSALVAGIILGKKLEGADVFRILRRARGERVLSNATFDRIVWSLAAQPTAQPAAPAPEPPRSAKLAKARTPQRGSYGGRS